MLISAKVDYAIRALAELAAHGGNDAITWVKAEFLADQQDIPSKFLEAILRDLRRAGIVNSQRGADGGFRMARPPSEVTLADVMRALEGAISEVRGVAPENINYEGAAIHLQQVWVALRSSLRRVLEGVTIADIVVGEFPPDIQELVNAPGAWERGWLR